MTSLDIARRRMRNSRLTGPSFETSDDVVRWHGAIQAQDYGPAKWSIGQRATKLTEADLDEALATGSIIRTHVLRPTWHLVARDDLRWLLELTGPRVHQHNGPRYRQLGLDGKTRARCERSIVAALEGGARLTRNALGGVLDEAGIDRSGQRLPFILMHCELEGAICSGGLMGKQQTYALADGRVPNDHRFDRDEALVELVRRYLKSHAPATVQDLRWWSSLTVADIKRALAMLGSEAQSETAEGLTFWSIGSDVARSRSAPSAHLLQTYDEFVVGYTQSRYFGDPRAEAVRAAWRDRSLPSGVVVVDGGVFGHWRRTITRTSVTIELHSYDEPGARDLRALERAGRDLGRFVDRDAKVVLSRP